MKNERENTSAINISAQGGVPVVSFGATSPGLKPESFDIAGNVFDAYYDNAHKLIFILDKTVDARKPNVMLIINPVASRKWDDILANDYAVDLETVRPKIDNKYQKLDIEYDGLSVYNKLINEHNANRRLDDALSELSEFRTTAARRSAALRLDASLDIISKTRETISKTSDIMRELQARLKQLRDKLNRVKKEVGKEPTKQSAAKILKAESQIDATNERLKRAKKRLVNAQRRIAVAEEDAATSRRILGQPTEINIKIPDEPKAEIMADDQVKPLFDKDPEIIDEKIAFKPIDFNITAREPEPAPMPEPAAPAPVVPEPTPEPIAAAPVAAETPTPMPLSFTPPTSFKEEVATTPAPVLESITEVSVPEPIVVNEPEPVVAERPASPITGSVAIHPTEHKRPALLYYGMLIVLIVLSIFTLWLYQKNTATDIAPELTAPITEIVETPPLPQVQDAPGVPAVVESPFIETVAVKESQPVVVDEPAPAPFDEFQQPAVLPAPVPDNIAPEFDIQPATPEPVYEEPVAPEYVAPQPAPATAQPQPVEKPAYDVSSNKTFVADENYTTY